MRECQKSHRFIGLLFLASCSVGPDYVRPSIEVPKAYKARSPLSWKTAHPRDQLDRGSWWHIFHDPLLNSLEEEALVANQNIAIAKAQYEQALALVDQARANFFPSISVNLSESKSRQTSQTSTRNNSISPLTSTGIQTTWETDLWGKIRQQVEADQAGAQASEAQLAAAQLSIQATLAQAYFQLRALDELQILLEESVVVYEKYLKTTKNQYKAGIASEVDLLTSDNQLQTIKAETIDNRIARAQLEHSIAVLINKPPSTFSISPQSARLLPPEIPQEVPSSLLERRPDIAQAERLVSQANAKIGIAKSAFFPTLTLSGSRGYENKNLGHLFSTPSMIWSLGTDLVETIFDGGSRSAAVTIAEASYQETVATYRQTVLAAFQNVEDCLSTLFFLKNERLVQDKSIKIVEKELTHMLNKKREGVVYSIDTLQALFNVYSTKRTAISLYSRQMTETVSLIQSLGGNFKEIS